MMKKLHKLVLIVDETVQEPYRVGTNDCNILVFKTLDLFCETNYTELAIGKYTSITAGKKLFKEHGFKSLLDVVKKHCTEVTNPIMGDIYIDGINASVFLHGTYVQIDHERHVFENVQIPKELPGKYYRIKTDKEG